MPKFYDQLLESAWENRTSDPSNLPYGRFWMRTDTSPNDFKVRGTSLTHKFFHSGVFTASGDIVYADAVNSFAILPKGSNGQVLALSAGLPAWTSPSITASVRSASTTDTILSNDDVLLYNGTFTATLPSAVTTKIYYIKNVGDGIITIATTSSQTIDGSLTRQLTVKNQTLMLVSDGSNWRVL